MRAHETAERLQETHPPTQRALARLAASRAAAADAHADRNGGICGGWGSHGRNEKPILEPHEEQIHIEDVTIFDDVPRSSPALDWFLRHKFDPSNKARSMIPWYWGKQAGELERRLFSTLWPMSIGPVPAGFSDLYNDDGSNTNFHQLNSWVRRHPSGEMRGIDDESKEMMTRELVETILGAVERLPGPAGLPMAAAAEMAYAKALQRRRPAVPASSGPGRGSAASRHGEGLARPSEGDSSSRSSSDDISQYEAPIVSLRPDDYILSLAAWSQPYERDPFLFDENAVP